MKDYFALLTKPRNFQKPQETEPSLPSKAPFDGNDGSPLSGFQKITAQGNPKAGEQKADSKLCERCATPMTNIEAGYFSCPTCYYQIVEAHSGFWCSAEACLEFDERAAILEFEAGITREEAEARAGLELERKEI